ncbi:hypothetical protein ESP57_08780 [Agromyces fucosus]|uniref:ABM domain-containing protein n=1 Tax=Agromyces fucosus TaxID=41985 RepID=A0A4Q2JRU5_9MICO|nr:hypothetical protein [Agromyces fucosus]RXZ49040.1 hypothetical protein ESP57_08780 [Agromyces fucosus]
MIIELTRFRAGREALLAARPAMLADFRTDRPGFIGARLVELPDHEWLDVVEWRSAADLALSRERGANLPGIAGFFSAIDELIVSEDGPAS